jgi:hypothetical protein
VPAYAKLRHVMEVSIPCSLLDAEEQAGQGAQHSALASLVLTENDMETMIASGKIQRSIREQAVTQKIEPEDFH